MIKDILVFSLSSNTHLTDKVCDLLGINRSEAEVLHFADGECLATSKVDVRGKKIYIIQSTCSPVNDRIMELLIFIDGIKRANCKEITLIIPYYGYARQDRIAHRNEPISARMVADLFSNAGVTRVLTVELHTPQIQGFFSVPLDNLTPTSIFAKYLLNKFKTLHISTNEVAIVAPDHGAMYRARDLSNAIANSSIVIIDKRRPRPNVAEITNIIGEIKDKVCVMVDDIIDTGGTILAGARTLKDKGARSVYICASHALFSHNALGRFEESDFIDEVLVTDTIEHPEFYNSQKVKVVSVSEMIADVIKSHESHETIKDKYTRFQ
ncbi:MAG: ribose-phosphate pyrophosphokinase [Firmicutes bacterium]|uniref:ribose-phosphate diphosphokinase n=1 Tax=Candidatus Onthovivens merdipullorum TaxID=2840889 RepID=A0A9D9GWR6_9BACL|nr:ribose-phosphate pyrophosphokinase [Candidatus Onthovivens merdipullorum]